MDDTNDVNGTAFGALWRRRSVLGALGAAPLAAGAVLSGTSPGTALAASEPSGQDRIPPDTRPGGAYDRYVAQLAAQDKFSGVVLLSHRGRTVLSRSYAGDHRPARRPTRRRLTADAEVRCRSDGDLGRAVLG